MKKILATTLIFSAIGLGVIAFGVGGSPRSNPNADAVARGPDVDNTSAIVQLKGDPISTNPSTKPPHGRKIDFNGQAVRSYRAQLNQKRNEFKRWLRTNAPSARVTSEHDVALNAVAGPIQGAPRTTIAPAPIRHGAPEKPGFPPNTRRSHQ